jgi:hypothetical protein
MGSFIPRFSPLESTAQGLPARAVGADPERTSLPHRVGFSYEEGFPGAGAGRRKWTNDRPGPLLLLRRVASDNDLAKRLIWSGLMAGIGALATIVAKRLAATIWRRVFDEDPPD